MALKLISLAQAGAGPSEERKTKEFLLPAPSLPAQPAVDWSIRGDKCKKYEEMFKTLVGPVGEKLARDKVKEVHWSGGYSEGGTFARQVSS